MGAGWFRFIQFIFFAPLAVMGHISASDQITSKSETKTSRNKKGGEMNRKIIPCRLRLRMCIKTTDKVQKWNGMEIVIESKSSGRKRSRARLFARREIIWCMRFIQDFIAMHNLNRGKDSAFALRSARAPFYLNIYIVLFFRNDSFQFAV